MKPLTLPCVVSIGEAVTLRMLHTDRFKTARLSLSVVLPADAQLSPRMTLLFGVLRRGCRDYPGQLHINRRLDELYGATLTIRNFHVGDRQVLGFTAEMLEDDCLPAADRGMDILSGVMELLSELLLCPLTDDDENGILRRDAVEKEKQALCDAILADRNQARSYAEGRLRHILYGDEPSGVSLFGRPEDIRTVTAEELTTLWKSFLHVAQIEVFYVGRATPAQVETRWRSAFADLDPSRAYLPDTRPHPCPASERRVDEPRQLAQGRLCMGWSSGLTMRDDRLPAAILFNEMLGVMQDSLLFRHVREERGLCYYCDSALFGSKGVLTVSCGISPENRREAERAIREQLYAVAAGDFSPRDVRLAKASYANAFRQIQDSPCALENLWFSRAINGETEPPEARLEAVMAVGRRELMATAAAFCPDTVYFLGGTTAAPGTESADDGLSDCDGDDGPDSDDE